MNDNDVIPIPSSSRDEALHFGEKSESQFNIMTRLWETDRANSADARWIEKASKHNRELAAVHAHLAVAEELREIRILLTAWLTQCTQVVI